MVFLAHAGEEADDGEQEVAFFFGCDADCRSHICV